MSAQFSRTQLELKCNTRGSSSFNPWQYTASLSNVLDITFILTFLNKLYLAFNLSCQLLITSPLLRLTDQRLPGTHLRKEKKKKYRWVYLACTERETASPREPQERLSRRSWEKILMGFELTLEDSKEELRKQGPGLDWKLSRSQWNAVTGNLNTFPLRSGKIK